LFLFVVKFNGKGKMNDSSSSDNYWEGVVIDIKSGKLFCRDKIIKGSEAKAAMQQFQNAEKKRKQNVKFANEGNPCSGLLRPIAIEKPPSDLCCDK
jgi:hypothetical protein